MLGSSLAMRIFFAMPSPALGDAASARACSGCGERDREAGAAPRRALHPHAAAEMLDDLPADVQSQAAAMVLVRERVAGLAELVENHALVGSIDAGAVVEDVHTDEAVLLAQRDLDRPIR